MELVGNKKAVNFINKVLESGHSGQAYLFSGPENVGKFFLAKIFASSLVSGKNNFFKEDGDAPLDVVILKPEIEEKKGIKKERDIPVEKIREVKMEMALFPYAGKKKVLIVDNAHRMNVSAQNGLLKMLEEPNSTSVVILVTHEDSKILPTIKSRCQKIVFSLVGKDDMKKMENLSGHEFFEKHESLSMGRPGLFHSLINNEEKLSEYEKVYSDYEKMSSLSLAQKIDYAEKISKDTPKAIATLNVWMWIIRSGYFNEGNGNPEKYYSAIGKIEDALVMLKNTNASARLVLEDLVISI